MMKISILTSSHSTFDSRIFHKQARSFAEAGHDVTLITPHTKNKKRDEVKIEAVGKEDVESANIEHAFGIYRKAKSMDAEAYHFHDPGLLPFGLLLKYTTNAKVIYDCHEQYEKAFKRYNFPPDKLNPLVEIYPLIQSLISNRFDAVVTTTEEAAKDFRRKGQSNVVVIRNFPTIQNISISKVPKQRDTEYLLVYVGGLDETRGFQEMLQLISELRKRDIDVGLWLIGPVGSSEKRFAEEIGVTEYVEFIGRIPHEDVFSYLQEGDVGLALLDPDRFEQDIPLKLFEYMAAEVPVVATPIGVSSKFVEDAWGIIVPFDNTKKQANRISELLRDQERRKNMGKKGRKAVETKFSWEIESKKLLRLYEDLNE